jgi:PAS domain S-box-containing protein
MENQKRSSLQNLSISYECALAIGNSLNLSEMLHEVIHTMVHKTNAHRGSIWVRNGEQKLQPVASAGISIGDVPAQGGIMGFQNVFNQILKRQQFVLRYKDDNDFLQYCPVLTEKEEAILIVPVTNVAILHMVYAGREIADKTLANLLAGLSKKLSVAIEACIAHENIIKEIQVREKAEKELTEKTEQLISSQKELQRLYGESEQARKSLLSILKDVAQKEKALRKSEEKYKTLYDSSRDAIMMLTLEQGYIGGNFASIKMFKCKDEDEFISKNPWDLSPEYQHGGTSSLVKGQEIIKIAMEKGSHFFDWKHKRIDGEEFFANVLLTKIELYGEIVLQATVRDITEQKRAEEELAKHREHLEELVKERTKELEEKNEKLAQFNKLFVDREFRIKELKDKIKELEEEARRSK